MRYKPIDTPTEKEFAIAAADLAKRFPDIDKDLNIAELLNQDAQDAKIVRKPTAREFFLPFNEMIKDL